MEQKCGLCIYVRDRISGLSYEDAYKACEQITVLGKMLVEQKVTIKVPDIELLEIKEGEYDMQRFVYHFFMKCFWNEELSWNDNVVVNYDWYHPQLCSKHTLEEVKGWFDKAELSVVQECVDFYGIRVRGRKAA